MAGRCFIYYLFPVLLLHIQAHSTFLTIKVTRLNSQCWRDGGKPVQIPGARRPGMGPGSPTMLLMFSVFLASVLAC